MSETGFIPGVPFLSQVKILILIHFLNFFLLVKIAQYNTTFSTHHTQYRTTHSIQDPPYISTAHHFTSQHMTPHHTTSHHITPHHSTSHYITAHGTTAQTRHFVVSLDCVCGVGVWVVCVLCLCCGVSVCGLHRSRVGFCGLCLPCGLLSVVLCRVVISLVVLPLVSVVLSLLRCVSVFCASCAFWCTHQHGNNKRGPRCLLCCVGCVSFLWYGNCV